MNATLKSYLGLFVAKHRHVRQILSPHNRTMGRFVDVVWCDLSVTFAMSRSHSYIEEKVVRATCPLDEVDFNTSVYKFQMRRVKIVSVERGKYGKVSRRPS